MHRNVNSGRNHYEMSQLLREQVRPGARVASSGHRGASLYLCFHLGARYYGDAAPGPKAGLEAGLREHRIDYLFVWKDAADGLDFLHRLAQSQ